jgi:hypothetical protein
MINDVCGSTGHRRTSGLVWQLGATKIGKCRKCGTHLIRVDEDRWVTFAELQPAQRRTLLRAAWNTRYAVRQPVTTVRLDDLLSQNQLTLERALQQMLVEYPQQRRRPRLLTDAPTVGGPAQEGSRKLPIASEDALVLAAGRTASLAPSEASERQSPLDVTSKSDGRQHALGTEICSEAEAQLLNLHRKLHLAMDRLINRSDYEAAETVLREVDQELVTLLNTATVR